MLNQVFTGIPEGRYPADGKRRDQQVLKCLAAATAGKHDYTKQVGLIWGPAGESCARGYKLGSFGAPSAHWVRESSGNSQPQKIVHAVHWFWIITSLEKYFGECFIVCFFPPHNHYYNRIFLSITDRALRSSRVMIWLCLSLQRDLCCNKDTQYSFHSERWYAGWLTSNRVYGPRCFKN